MNKAEIMTLLSAKVPAAKIRTAIMAGKLSGILRSADMDISRAENFRSEANWEEMLRIMEGTLDTQVDHEARPGDSKKYR